MPCANVQFWEVGLEHLPPTSMYSDGTIHFTDIYLFKETVRRKRERQRLRNREGEAERVRREMETDRQTDSDTVYMRSSRRTEVNDDCHLNRHGS